MITNIKQAITNKLLEIYPEHTIYDEDVPQNFMTPSFLISLIDQDYEKRLSNKYRSDSSFEIVYFSDKGNTEIKEDCLNVQLNLLRAFDIVGTYRVINKKAQITDNVLHITFEIKYSEMKVETQIPMQTQQTNTNI